MFPSRTWTIAANWIFMFRMSMFRYKPKAACYPPSFNAPRRVASYPNPKNAFRPEFRDEATLRGALNEGGFGWGAAVGDLNLDGWLDLVQANGMVDDSVDKRFSKPHDYWYVAEKMMLSGPDQHSYA